jgi:protein-tyrosine-phosphatase
MPSVLFVCTANRFRSPIAAACFRQNLEKERPAEKWIVASAGTWTSDDIPAPKIAMQVARQLGLDGLNDHRTRQIDQKLLDQFDLIVTMEAGHKEAISTEFPSVCGRLYLLSEIVDGILYDIPDPAEVGVIPNQIGRELHMLIDRGTGKIRQLATSLSKSGSV